MPDALNTMWSALAAIGRAETGGGYDRAPFSPAEQAAQDWFARQCQARGLALSRDGNGNVLAWWTADPDRAPAAPERTRGEPAEHTSLGAIMVGTHFDTIPNGGNASSAVGVITALAAIDQLASTGFRPARDLVIAAFIDTKGTRFNQPHLGARLATGQLGFNHHHGIHDRDGVTLDEVLAANGHSPNVGMSSWWAGIDYFVELDIAHAGELADHQAPIGLVTDSWAYGRYRFEFRGQPSHAGVDLRHRHDPMLTCAMVTLAVNKQARVAGQRATVGRIEVDGNQVTTVASQVTAWVDIRARSDQDLAQLIRKIARQAHQRAHRDGTQLSITEEYAQRANRFSTGLLANMSKYLRVPGTKTPVPLLASPTTHNADVFAAAGIPAALFLVRNSGGGSRADAEVAPADRHTIVRTLAHILRLLTKA